MEEKNKVKKILFFDTETTGIPKKGTNWEKDYETFPYIVQIAWIAGEKEYEHIIKPDGWDIPEEVVKIHGIDKEKAIAKGESNKKVLERFLEAAEDAEIIVGHNIYFDTSIIKANLLRLGHDVVKISDALHKDKRFCTMQKSTSLSKKWLKLKELHQLLFNSEIENAHTALGDVRATRKCYYELVKINKKK